MDYLEALTYTFEREDESVSCVLIYARPDAEIAGVYHPRVAAETGFEGIACVDDTARAALLALEVYERTNSSRALSLAKRWLTFLEYMQYPDGQFANFIRNGSGVRNATGPTSHRGGYWWSSRALWALARAYRITGRSAFLERYQACYLEPIPDGKINAILGLAKLELYRIQPSPKLGVAILEHCQTIVGNSHGPYLLDHPDTTSVQLWGYHQLHCVASGAGYLAHPELLAACKKTVRTLIEPNVKNRFWYSYPDMSKSGVCAYNVTPIVVGLGALYDVTKIKKYRQLALQGCRWFYGRNDAGVSMYDPHTGRCRDGIDNGVASNDCGAESSIEAGFAEMEKRRLEATL